MKKKYGGIDGGQAIEDVQEAVVVETPKEPATNTSNRSVIFVMLGYYLVTYFIVEMLIIATGLSEQQFYMKLPLPISLWLIPSLPFILTAVYFIRKGRKTKQKEEGR